LHNIPILHNITPIVPNITQYCPISP
jgi:hypothetical protein